MTIKLCLVGFTGRMGHEVREAVENRDNIDLINGVSSSEQETDEFKIYSASDSIEAFKDVDIVIDFSNQEAVSEILDGLVETDTPLVTGTTGLSSQAQKDLEEAAEEIPVLQSFNFSTGVNVFWEIVEMAASYLPGYDYEVMDAHHRHKLDNPSGTTKTILERIQSEIGERDVIHGREGEIQREDEIGVHSIRAGEIIGVHSVYISGPGEYLELTHRAVDRTSFAEGSLDAAEYLVDKDPGLYGMNDLLGL